MSQKYDIKVKVFAILNQKRQLTSKNDQNQHVIYDFYVFILDY